jgi:ABC-2 type transport system ATP-binding protein
VAAADTGQDPGYTVQTLHFAVTTEADNSQPCDIIGDLYTPNDAGPAHRVPAILTTNGFGGSKDDQAGLGKAFAARDYVVLSYSGLGFGGSGCKITLDDPDTDGKAASQLVSFLGGQDGIAYTDAAHTQPVAGLDDVIHDDTDHVGNHDPYDPRVGMIGGSYGGEIQFATASVDPRVDALIPLITWNDLSYALAPNNTDLTTGVSSTTPGAAKLVWAALFFTEGALVDGLQGLTSDPSRDLGCPNFNNRVCSDLTATFLGGYPTPDTTALLRHASVASYLGQIRVPVLLAQGENDTLFNLNEAVATYQALKAQGTPVKMIWQSWGHSSSTPAPGEVDLNNPDPATQYETGRFVAWFDHYLAGKPADTGPDFAYFQDWVPYTGNAAAAYASAPSYPVGAPQRLYLSANNQLVDQPAQIRVGAQGFLTPPAGLPTSSSGLDGVGSVLPGDFPPDTDLPGTYATWTSAPLSSALNVVGEPTVDVRMVAPTASVTGLLGPGGDLVVFAKIYDVAPNGQATLIHHLIAPARVGDPTKPVHITLPAIVHQFAPGHRIELVIASGDLNYRGGLAATPVTIATGDAGQALTLPTVG